MGTFRLTNVATVESLSGGRSSTCGSAGDAGWQAVTLSPCSTDPALIAGFPDDILFVSRAAGPACSATGTLEYGFDQNTPIFELDGDPAISFNSLPAGFFADSCILNFELFQHSGNGGALTVKFLINDVVVATLTESSSTLNFSYDICQGLALSALDIINTRIKFEVSYPTACAGGDNSTVMHYINNYPTTHITTGTYFIFVQTYTLEYPTPVDTGDTITITSTDPDPLDMTQIDSITLTFDGGSIVVPTWTVTNINLLTFLIPSWGIFTPTTVSVVITSTQFSGSVTLGRLITIFFQNATGIYTLVMGKTSDTLYDNDNPTETLEAAIPNPFFETGPIGG